MYIRKKMSQIVCVSEALQNTQVSKGKEETIGIEEELKAKKKREKKMRNTKKDRISQNNK